MDFNDEPIQAEREEEKVVCSGLQEFLGAERRFFCTDSSEQRKQGMCTLQKQ